MLSVLQILDALLGIIWFIVIAHVILSWLVNFQVLNLHQPLVAQIWSGLNRLTDPIYSRIRRVLPNMGGIDLSPIIVLFALFALRTVINNNMYHFY